MDSTTDPYILANKALVKILYTGIDSEILIGFRCWFWEWSNTKRILILGKIVLRVIGLLKNVTFHIIRARSTTNILLLNHLLDLYGNERMYQKHTFAAAFFCFLASLLSSLVMVSYVIKRDNVEKSILLA